MIIKQCECGAIFKLDMDSIIKHDRLIYVKPVRIIHIRGTDFKVYGVEIVCPVCGKILGGKFDESVKQKRGDDSERK